MTRSSASDPAAVASRAIAFEQVTVQFAGSDRPAVANITATIHPGELVVLLGTSGSGKTTLLKTVNRLCEVSAGSVRIGDRDVRQWHPVALRRHIGYAIQQVGLFPHLTVARNVAIVPQLLGWEPARIRDRVDALLDQVALPPGEFRDRYPAQLSGGQQQRVGIARALAGDPDILLMDEPFGALDALTRSALQTTLRELQQRLHKTVLFVSHDVDEALKLGDRIGILHGGTLEQLAPPAEVLLRPATPFVRDLVGSDDVIRCLGALTAATAAVPWSPAQPGDWSREQLAALPAIAPDTNLRDALAHLLNTAAPALIVGTNAQPVGYLTWEHLQTVVQQPANSSRSGLVRHKTTE